MKFYGIELISGTQATNFIVEHGTANPSMSTGVDPGRLFFNTSSASLDVWNGTSWRSVASDTEASVTGFKGPNNPSTAYRTGNVLLQANDLIGLLTSANLPIASAGTLGCIKLGSGLSIDVNGVLSASGGSGGDIPSGTRMLFAEPSAPVGWTQATDVAANNRMLRVVSVVGGTTGAGGTGGDGYGGDDDPTIMNKVPSHTHGFSGSISTVGDHTHYQAGYNLVGGGGSIPWYNWANGAMATNQPQTGAAGGHSHTITATISANSGADNWMPKYLNLILCSKN